MLPNDIRSGYLRRFQQVLPAGCIGLSEQEAR